MIMINFLYESKGVSREIHQAEGVDDGGKVENPWFKWYLFLFFMCSLPLTLEPGHTTACQVIETEIG